MSEPTTPYVKGPPGVPADQLPTQKDSPTPRPAIEPFRPRVFAEYELLSEVARGGMGVVYRARQVSLNRVVAVKMILGGQLATAEDVSRFRKEAEAAARLQHPNIVAVFEVDEAEGQHFFSMEYIEGQSLAQLLARGPLPSKVAGRYLRTLAQAVHYAHRQGIIHRDLKPSNILIDGEDQPHITDFGLAKKLHEDTGSTRTGTVLGTPSYMAPEQAQGRTHEVGPVSDVYSLGAILYECLTGRPPFRADNIYETVSQVIHDEPSPPRSFVSEIDEDLEQICMKCLEKDAALRYANAEELAEDLGRYLQGEPISARSVNVLDRLTRVLDRSQHDHAFHTWSSMLYVMAVVIGVEHVLVFFLMFGNAPPASIFAARFLQFVILGMLFVFHRGNRLLPTTAAERELWSIWIGYFATYALGIFATRTIGQIGLVTPGPEATPFLVELLPYPFISLVAGLSFFVMGSNYWGRCYLFGAAFWMIGAVMPFYLQYAPLAFGLMWSVALAALGVRLDRLARKAGLEAQPRSSSQDTRVHTPQRQV